MSVQPGTLVTEQDLVMREAAQRLQEMPDFISYAQQRLKGALLGENDLDRVYTAAARTWVGQIDFSRDVSVRKCVKAVFTA